MITNNLDRDYQDYQAFAKGYGLRGRITGITWITGIY